VPSTTRQPFQLSSKQKENILTICSVIQFIITLANYDYVFSYKFNQAGEITVETRATGIVSVINIDPGKTSTYGNVVSPGVLAQNHQHIFAIRIDPAIEGHKNSIIVEESHPVPTNPETNPRGNFYEIKQDIVGKSTWLDASPFTNRVIKMVNPNIKNPISSKPIGYKFTPSPTQLLLADENSLQSKRAKFARHHVWVTKHRDGEFYAAGRYTLQSDEEIGGLADIVERGEGVEDEDVVVWNCFGLTHNPRVEDWPVM
jgi:primary-amine oxidase